VNSARFTYTYDSSGNKLTDLYEQWDSTQWVNSGREAYTYDSKGNELTFLYELWVNGNWVNDSRETYTYDTKGNELTYLIENWVNGQWANSTLLTNTYNSNGYTLSMLNEEWGTGQWANKNISLSFQDSKKHKFSFYGYKIEITYQGASPVKETVNSIFTLNCFPNPVNDNLIINYSAENNSNTSIKITNEVGICVYQDEGINNSININTSNLSPGVYFLTIREGKNIETRKFVVIK
jgi:hypothetical protein